MAEFNRLKTKSFHPKMRLKQLQPPEKKNINYPYFRFYKWILYISLSLYFLTSFLISHKPILPLSQTHFSESHSAVASRALFESSTNSSTRRSRSQSNTLLLKDLKIFVYELPPEFNSDWLSNHRCSNHLFASEVAIHKAIANDQDVRTYDPYEADFFFVPVYVSCNFSKINGFPAIGHARSLISSAIRLISSDYPFWNRSQGADHIFVASHDFGSCFHTLEDRAIEDGVPEFMRRSIVLQTFGVKYRHPCQEVDNVVIPPYVSPESVRRTLEKAPVTGRRDIWAFFRGKMEVHPKNVSGRYYSKKVRTAIWRKFNGDRRFYLQRQRFSGYQSEIVRSTFCLCPLGWAPWSPRLVESVALGCVPVIIADGIRLPFREAVPWPEISLTVAEKDVEKLGEILEHVAATNLSRIQRNLWDPEVRRALMFNEEVEEGDATWQVLYSLAQKLDRSRRTVRHSDH
ncbi:Probable glucuronoxylan glucuronosyltransferase IRX7 [Linum grandiflorum]